MLPYILLGEIFMFRVMVFIDYQNFNINLKEHYKGKTVKAINYISLGKTICKYLPFEAEVIKTYLFAYKPCDKLMEIESYSKFYSWLCSLRKTPYMEIIEGRQEIRKISNDIEININDPKTYRTEEKETDINLATHMLSKGFQNAYDVAILVSGDTDYIKVVETLHNIGKVVVIAHFQHQNVNKYDEICDANFVLYDKFLNESENGKHKSKESD